MKKICAMLLLGTLFFNLSWAWAKTSKNFDLWLYELGAYDLFVNQKFALTPALVKPFLESCFKLKKYEQIINFFHTQTKLISTLPSPTQKSIYLIYARALRAQGDFFEAAYQYARLKDLLSPKELKKVIKTEPNLDNFILCACLDQLWSTTLPDPLKWQKILNFALASWPNALVFKELSQLKLSPPVISPEKKYLLGLKLILIDYLGLNPNIFSLQSFSNWQKFMHLLLAKDTSNNLWQEIFGQDFVQFQGERFQTNSTKLKEFINHLNLLSAKEGLVLIQKQLSSIFIEPAVKKQLSLLYFAYLIFNHKLKQAQKLTRSLASNDLKLNLVLARLNNDPQLVFKLYPTYSKQFLKTSLALVGFQFTELKDPLHPEPLSMLAYYQRLTAKRELNYTSAYQLSFLFPHSYWGQQAHLFLAKNAYKKGQKKLAWTYLKKVNPKLLGPKTNIEFLKAKAGLLMELDHPKQALQVYLQLLSDLKPNQLDLDPVKIVKLGLLAQRLGQLALAENIFTNLLTNFPKLSSSLRAETYFWLAETYQLEQKNKQAIKEYLKVAYFYPQEHIWAITALYRAAQLSEQLGNTAMAKKLYTLVIKKADQKSQKQAAKQRLQELSPASDHTYFIY